MGCYIITYRTCIVFVICDLYNNITSYAELTTSSYLLFGGLNKMSGRNITSADFASSSFEIPGNTDAYYNQYLIAQIDKVAAISQSEMYRGKSDSDKDLEKRFIILHGVMGSELYAGEKIGKFEKNTCLWIETSKIIGQPDKNRALKCNEDGSSSNKVVTAGIDDMNYQEDNDNPKYGATDLYTSITKLLKTIHGNDKVMYHNYDWRLGVEVAVDNLKSEFDKIVSESDITYIIAHSMGGLVACHYLKTAQSADKIRLITLGTPFLGSPKALWSFGTGDVLDGTGVIKTILNETGAAIMKKSMNEILPNIMGVYDLLPTPKYLEENKYYREINKSDHKAYSDKLLDAGETYKALSSNKFNLNNKLYDKSMEFHNKLDVLSVIKGMKHSCAVVGYNQNTTCEVVRNVDSYYVPVYNAYNMANPRYESRIGISFDRNFNKDGDSTVPLCSATIGGELNKLDNRLFYIKAEHADLASSDSTIGFVVAKIDNWDKPGESCFGYNQSALCKEIEQEAKKEIVYSTLLITLIDEFCTIDTKIYNIYSELLLECKNQGFYTISKSSALLAETYFSQGISTFQFEINKNDSSDAYTVSLPKNKITGLIYDGTNISIKSVSEVHLSDRITVRLI